MPYLLSDEDHQKIRQLLDGPTVRESREPLRDGALPAQIEAMVVYSPSGGIAARSGTTPGKADCTPAEILWSADTIQVITSDTIEVFNVSGVSVPGSIPCLAVRVKDGHWVVVTAAGGIA